MNLAEMIAVMIDCGIENRKTRSLDRVFRILCVKMLLVMYLAGNVCVELLTKCDVSLTDSANIMAAQL